MKQTIGSLIVTRRNKLKIDRDKLAKKIGITTAYVAHLEKDRPVHLSEALIKRLSKTLHMRSLSFLKLKPAQDKKVRAYRYRLAKKK